MTQGVHQAVVAFGSNLNNPKQQVLQALAAVRAYAGIRSVRPSSLYITAPVGYLDQPDFVNMVALVETDLTAVALMTALLAIEQDFGRERAFANSPRSLDLDLIDYDHQVSDTEFLMLPHPRAHERGFVMHPLAEVAPEYVLGAHGSAAQLAADLGMEGVRKEATPV
ncbi:MAG: 2-amino-4-hydroxy-6-hydroxymethyldihydropteridine diphosphokinase [Neisseriaceae bacterium]|nr:2-amino-4-hydroxy-6-hydroxymethyldihydropteridine diphosphokinase [Neisseriaceae bacterium]MBP6861824.1 2-amino-4-hydroxy-6-hydroxymethyldihydropteridine diphosphokinase [Neisseriaceae bacterium]